jgi:hypothetical protein
MMLRRGMGEYPGYYCYDAERPSWLPYWLDDFTESACKWSPKTIAGNIASCATGSPDCGTPTGDALDPTKSGPGVAAPGEPTNVPRCGSFQVYNPASNQCELDIRSPSFLLLAGAAVGVVLLLGRR